MPQTFYPPILMKDLMCWWGTSKKNTAKKRGSSLLLHHQCCHFIVTTREELERSFVGETPSKMSEKSKGRCNTSQVVKNQLDRVLINHSSFKQKEKKTAGGASKTIQKSNSSNSEKTSNTNAYEEYRRSMGLPCNLITK